ncbi:MAG: hypothetical protein NC301_09325 [Bacteroides sp.]|nr:hypothetical protein [Alistipes timonensis]MCM1311202.1 hypothetical protein [Bacteroides sp.]MCM1406516.1 hypothetical protein [[Clostridium] fimetarium]
MSFNEKTLFWICVILTMAMAMTALMISLPRTIDFTNPTRLDYQGTIVTIFAALVTVLVGWQIYSVVGIESRVRKAEKRLSNTMLRLNEAQDKIEVSRKSSEDYSTGTNLLAMAMIEFVQTNLDKSMPIEARTRHFRNCYAVSAKSIVHLVSSNKDDELIASLVGMCVQCMDLSAAFLFKDGNVEAARAVFTEDIHEKCDAYFKEIMKNSFLLGAENVVKINEHRLNRHKLLTNK